MAVHYTCGSELRRQKVRDPDTELNGIDYLEVLDRDAPPGIAPQRTLLVKFLKPVTGLRDSNVHIEGGVRVTGIDVVWAFPTTEMEDPPVPPGEQSFFAMFTEADHWLVIRTGATGDFSSYRLRLVEAPTLRDRPPAGVDPQLAEVEFNFKVECPSDFDCKAPEWLPAPSASAPVIDYLAKDYASFRRLMLDRLSLLMPDWRERNIADIGIVVTETLAYAADQLSYFQDAVATEAYLGTARKRISTRRHARLLDYHVHEGCNARAWVALEVEPGGDADGRLFPAGSTFITRGEDLTTRVDPSEVEREARAGAEVFESLHPVTLRAAHNAIPFYTWHDEDCALPKGATRATLRDDAAVPLALRPGDILIVEEKIDPATGSESDADPSHRQAVRLVRTRSTQDPLDGQPVLEIEWGPEDALAFALPVSSAAAAKPPGVAHANVVLADHGRRFEDEKLDPEEVGSESAYRPRLPRTGLTHREAYDHGARLDAPAEHPAALATRQDPARALPDVGLHEDDQEWTLRRDLLGSDRFAPDFVIEMEEGGEAFLRFGDGVMGRAPQPGAAFSASYRVGSGSEGNVGPEVITRVAAPFDGVRAVRNPLPAEGGTDPERLERVRLDAPRAFRRQERAVTEADYAALAERHPEVQRAVAARRWTGSWYTIFVTIDRRGGREVDAAFEAELRAFLERFRLAGYDLEIDGPRFVSLDIAMTVCVDAHYSRSDVAQALLQTFASGELPDGRRGFFHPDHFTFGQPVYLSRVVGAAMAVPGVVWVDLDDTPPKTNRFRRFGEPSRGEFGEGRIRMGRLEIARLLNDPSQPEGGKLELFMRGGV